MAGEHAARTAEVRGLGQREDAEIPLFEVPFDGLVANVTYTPSEDIRGELHARDFNLSAYPTGTVTGGWLVAQLRLYRDHNLLPSGEKRNANMLFPPVQLRVYEGETLSWTSVGSVGPGLTVPAGLVEVVFERKDAPPRENRPELFPDYVPSYWLGKTVLVEHADRDVYALMIAREEYTAQHFETTGTFLDVDASGIRLQVRSSEPGGSLEVVRIPLGYVETIKLVEEIGPPTRRTRTVTDTDNKQRFMEAACELKSRENRVMSTDLMERMGWETYKNEDQSEFRSIAEALHEDGDIRPNEYMNSSGVSTGEAASWDFFWVTPAGLKRWCSTE